MENKRNLFSPLIVSNASYLLASLSASGKGLYLLSVMLLGNFLLSVVYHLYRERKFRNIDVFFAHSTVAYVFLLIAFGYFEILSAFTGLIIFLMSMYFHNLDEITDDNYERNHTVWHMLSGLSIIVMCL
jgi:hypothetical protein